MIFSSFIDCFLILLDFFAIYTFYRFLTIFPDAHYDAYVWSPVEDDGGGVDGPQQQAVVRVPPPTLNTSDHHPSSVSRIAHHHGQQGHHGAASIRPRGCLWETFTVDKDTFVTHDVSNIVRPLFSVERAIEILTGNRTRNRNFDRKKSGSGNEAEKIGRIQTRNQKAMTYFFRFDTDYLFYRNRFGILNPSIGPGIGISFDIRESEYRFKIEFLDIGIFF